MLYSKQIYNGDDVTLKVKDGKVIDYNKTTKNENDTKAKVEAFKEKKSATTIKENKAIRDEKAPIKQYNKPNVNIDAKRTKIAKEIAIELDPSLKNASDTLLQKRAGEIMSYYDGELLENDEKPYTNIYGGLERSTKYLEEWLEELKKTSTINNYKRKKGK